MRRGTDVCCIIKLDNFDTEDINKALVTFKQSNVLIDKYASIVDEDEIRVDFTPEETSMFLPGEVEIQVKILTTDNKTVGTNIMRDRVCNILSEVEV